MRRTLAVLVTLLCTLAGLTAALTTAPTAQAGGPGRWTTISGGSSDIGTISRASAVRTPDGLLHVVYVRKDATLSYSIRHVAVAANGATSRASTVISDWDSLTRDPEVVVTPTGLRVVFSGLRNDMTFDPYTNGAVYWATSDLQGTAWTLQTTYLSDTKTAYGSYGTGAVTMSDGSTFLAWPLNSTIRYANTVVADPDSPAEDPALDVGVGTSAYDVEMARVPGTDEVWISWFNLSNDAAKRGVWVQRLAPALGAAQRAPLSVTRFQGETYATQFSGPPALVARGDGSVTVAYPVGYPTRTRIAVWRVGTATPSFLPASGNGRYVDLSVGAGGRIWAAWASGDTVRAARSNPGGNRFGSPVTLGFLRVAGNPSTWDVQVNAAGGPADVLVNTSRQLVHQRVLARLTLTASPGSWDGDRPRRVVFRVTDAGTPIGGAVVRAAGERCTTNGSGTCRITFGRSGPRKIGATATKGGYTAGATSVRVRR